MKLPKKEHLGKSHYAGRTRKPDGEGFSRGSTVSVAWLSKGHSNLCVSSPNQYALLESEVSSSTGCNMNGSQSNPNETISSLKPDYTKLAPWVKKHTQMHQCFHK